MAEKKEDLIFTEINGEDKAVLGILEGPCADFISSTRNGRKYSESLWQKVFSDPIVNEMIENGGIPGELDHPTDREETDSSRIAILLKEKPKKKNGKLWARFSILGTPMGKIAYTLAKAGFKFGVSSRGSGEVVPDFNGNESVDESTYDFKCFDLVLLPAVKEARLNLITESYDINKFDYKKALRESLESANDDDRKLMEETLDNLQIDITENKPEKVEDKDVDSDEEAANDDGADIVRDLQESLKLNKELENKVLNLQEKLSVCYAKEAKYEEELGKYKSTIISLSESAKKAKELKVENDSLVEQLDKKTSTEDKSKKLIESVNRRSQRIADKNKSLTESIDSLKQQLDQKESVINDLKHSLRVSEKLVEKTKSSLKENLEEVKQNSAIKAKEYSQKIERANKLVEHYKKIADASVSRYIESKAKLLGVTSNEIRSKLNENYSFSDIDEVCDSLKTYQLNVSKLPFSVTKGGSTTKARITESKEPLKRLLDGGFDDTVDSTLLTLAGLNKK